MRAKLANLNHCAVPFLSRAAANLCWYYNTAGCDETTGRNDYVLSLVMIIVTLSWQHINIFKT